MSKSLELQVAGTWDGEPIADDERVTFRLATTRGGLSIEVDAPFHDDPPPPGKPGPCDRLWEFEVAELFIVGTAKADNTSTPLYTELELSPHGHYLTLRLEGVRRIVEGLIPIPYRSQVLDTPWQGKHWRGRAIVPWQLLPPAPHRLNAFAMHGVGSSRRYLAMTPVPGPEPDFHRLDAYQAIELPLAASNNIGSRARRKANSRLTPEP